MMFEYEFRPCKFADQDAPGVLCENRSACRTCGWNPNSGMREKRIAAFVRRRATKGKSMSNYEPERPLDEPEYDGPVCDECGAEIGSGETCIVYENKRICRECLIECLRERISQNPFEIAEALDFGTSVRL